MLIVNEIQSVLPEWEAAHPDGKKAGQKGKSLADRKDLKFSPREIESLTDSDVLDMIDRRFDYSKKQYIPMRKDTPELLRFIAWYEDNRTIHNNPISMQVSKVSQALEVEGEYGETNKPHDMTPEDLLEITHGMDTPRYIVYQEDLGRYAVIVDYYDGKKRQHGFAAFDIGEPRSENEIVDYEGGYYNTAVTMFNRNDLESFLAKEENVIKYDKEKGLSAAASDNLVSWRNRQDSSHKTKIPQNGEDVNGKKSDRDNLGYHAGDLGKAEHLNIQGRSRGTGHFGTGTYFVGVKEKVTEDS